MKIKRLYWATIAVLAVCALASSARAQSDSVLVTDTWNDAATDGRNFLYPADAEYAENNGVTAAYPPYGQLGDTNYHSAWFSSSGSALTTPAVGDMRATLTGSSLSMYTYFTSNSTDVSLANIGDEMKLTWVFTPNGTMTGNTAQGLNLAVVQTPSNGRVTGDGASPNNENYTNGYAMFMNFAPTLNNGNSFLLKKWNTSGSSALLSSQGLWKALTNTAVSGNTGYAIGTNYTYTFDAKLTVSGLLITSTMAGGNVNNTGLMTDTYLDPSVTSDTFDTFDVRPSGSPSGASTIDTSLFEVEFISVPEPSTVMLVLAGFGMMIGLIRRRRS